MKRVKSLKNLFVILFVGAFTLSSYAQRMQQYTWDDYKTKFSVPTTFVVNSSTGEMWSGGNDDINLTIFPRKGENLSQQGMDEALINWANGEGVTGLGNVTDIDSQKLNGYWGVFIEGNKGEFPVCLMLIIDPDYPDTSMYIWVSYRAGMEDTVLKILYSFTPA